MVFPYVCVDLSHELTPTMATWDLTCGFHQKIQWDYHQCSGERKFRVMETFLYNGIGTHMDAPSHCFPEKKSVSDFFQKDLIMPLEVMDISHKCHENYVVTKEDMEHFEKKHGLISPGCCFMVYTGWETFWKNPEKYHNNHIFPRICSEAAAYLLHKNIEILGIDTLSSDGPNKEFPVHGIFLGAEKILLENVVNLSKMPPKGSWIIVAPLKMKNATESPVTLIGLLEKK